MDNSNCGRYLIDFDLQTMEKEYYDCIILGSGIAGIYTALEIPPACKVAILTKDTINISNSVLAQGGIAVSMDNAHDSPELHFKDTLKAGAGLCDAESVWILVNEAASNIKTLFKYGVNFDMKNKSEPTLSREAAHSTNRIIHAGDTTGKEVCDKLTAVAYTRNNIMIKERTLAVDLVTVDDEVKAIIGYDEDKHTYKAYISTIVICATGGYGYLYKSTTNPNVSTGDGASMAYRAGAKLMDLEFVQFHPTVLYHKDNKSFLISEAVRGEGALLRNINGETFMENYHEQRELAPRDIVSRAIFAEMKKTNSDHVFVDVTSKDPEYFKNRFPNIYKTCMSYGIDFTKEFIPVAPAQHYCMGGIHTDIYGRTNIKGLYACGESACNGIHGANRLASNSLLEGLVFGRKIGDEVTMLLEEQGGKSQDANDVPDIKYVNGRIEKDVDSAKMIEEIREAMTDFVGIIRTGEGLSEALHKVEAIRDYVSDCKLKCHLDFELANMSTLAVLVIKSCIERTESRGGHYRSDYPETLEVWRHNIIV